ncbi:MAG: hypothetical protein ACE5OZ_17205 [Candidatus Heimdallarchaeota archaeon]
MTSENLDEGMDDQLNHEMRRIEAAQRVLKRKGLDFLEQLGTGNDPDKPLSVETLWQNEEFLVEVEAAIEAELAPDPGGVRRFLADFEVQIEDLDARWLLTLWWQASGTRKVDFSPLIREYQDVYSRHLLQELETLQETTDIKPLNQHRLDLWQQVAKRELVDSALAPLRTGLRQDITNHCFQHHGRDYTTSQITTMILRENPDRKSRRTAWNSLVQLSQQIVPKMRELIMQANAYWQKHGYENANAPRLQALGVNELIVREIIASIERETRPIAKLLLKEYKKCLGYEVAQWDWRFAGTKLPYSFGRPFKNGDAITCLKKTYKNLGIDVEQLPIHFAGDSAGLGVSYNAVRVPHDIIFSYGPVSGAREYFALLHALGEACYFTHIDADLPYAFRRYAPEVLGEGFAILSSWLLWEYDWLEEFTNLSPEEIVRFSQQMRNYELLKLRYSAGVVLFELDAYQILANNSDVSLDKLFENHMKTFLPILADGRWAWAPDPWLIAFSSTPFYTSNVLGLAVAANLVEYLHEKDVSLFSKETGKLFRADLVQQGASSPWWERLHQQTAKPLIPFPISWSRAW